MLRAKALLMAADGEANTRIAEDIGVTPVTVRAWRQRFSEDGLAGLEKIREGRGRKPSIPEETIAAIVRLTTTTTPEGATHWSCRTMAKRVGVSSATVQRIWLCMDEKSQIQALGRTQASLPMVPGRGHHDP